MKRHPAPVALSPTLPEPSATSAKGGGEPIAPPLAAGDFSVWMANMGQALRGERVSDVPCGDCTACCTSSQFVHIGPDETATLAHVPAQLLFPAPGLPRGHVLLGYDERGHCPMLIEGRCSIYEHRPRTCRTYDCRAFPAAGVGADDDKIFIVRQSRRWEFGFPTDADRVQHEAVRAAARFLDERRGELPIANRPANATQLAVLALEVHHVFLAHDERTGQRAIIAPALETVVAALTLRAKGGRGKGGRPKGGAKLGRSNAERAKMGRDR